MAASFLVFALSVVLQGCTISHFVQGVDPLHESGSFKAFWHRELPSIAMPEALRKLASPLSPATSRLLLRRLQGGHLQLSSKQICKSAQIYCSDKQLAGDYFSPRVCVLNFFQYEYGEIPCENGVSITAAAASASSAAFFLQKAVMPGKILQLPDTTNNLGGIVFLPESLSKALPSFRPEHFLEVSKIFGLREGSDMGVKMNNTLAHCALESKHEIKSCVTSGEGMVSFVKKTLGQDVLILSPTSLSREKAKVMDLHLLNDGGKKAIICHDMKFPSMVYSCHMTETTRVLNVSLSLADDKKVVYGVAICHHNTSFWNPTHIAFKVLNTQPGHSSICHWLPENTFVFVQQKHAV